MHNTLIALAVLLLATGSAHAAPLDCKGLAEVAYDVAESRAAGLPTGFLASYYRAQMLERSVGERAAVERTIQVVAALDEKPEAVRHLVFLKCKAGEFDPVKK